MVEGEWVGKVNDADESKSQAPSLVFECLTWVRAFIIVRCSINRQARKSAAKIWSGSGSQFWSYFWLSLPAWSRTRVPICSCIDQNRNKKKSFLSLGWGRITHSVVVKTIQHNYHLLLEDCLENLDYFLIQNTFWIVYGAHTVLAQTWVVVVDCFVASIFIKKNREISRFFQSLNLTTLIISSNLKRYINLACLLQLLHENSSYK